MTERTPDRPRWVVGALGPTNRTASISPDVNDPGKRNVTYDRARRGLPRAGPRARRRRRRPAARRDDLRHAQRQGGDLRPRDAVRGARPPLAGDHLRARSPTRPGARCPARSPRRSGTPCGTPARSRSASTARSAPTRCGPTSPSCPASPTPSCPATRTPGCPTPSASTTRRPTRPPRSSRSSPGSGLVNLLGGCCGTTPEHIAAIAEAADGKAPRVAGRDRARRCGCPASSRSTVTDGVAVRQRRRAHQHHRLGAVPQADQGRRLHHRARRSRASRSRPARRSSTSTWTRG